MSKPNWRQQLEEKERREKEREEQMRREKEEKLRQLQMEAKSAADAAPSLVSANPHTNDTSVRLIPSTPQIPSTTAALSFCCALTKK